MRIAFRTSRSIPVHGDDASAAHNYLEDMGMIKSNGEAEADPTDGDPLHPHTPLLDGGDGAIYYMGRATAMETHVSLHPGHPSGKTWDTARASRRATGKPRERLTTPAMVASLVA